MLPLPDKRFLTMKNWRFYTFVFFIGLIFVVLVLRLFSLQIIKHSFYKKLAENQHQNLETVYPLRGEMFMKDKHTNSDSRSLLFPIAINKDYWTIYAVPKEIKEKEEAVTKLSPFLNISEEELKKKISKLNDPYELLKNKVDEESYNKIKDLNIDGVYFRKENWRYFPAGEMACHLVGFVGFNGDEKVGRYGLEEYYEEELSGKTGFIEAKKDSLGELINVGEKILAVPEDGADLILTIDPNIQYFIEGKIKQRVQELEATSGTIIVMETKSGAIKAMASWPTFNPNKYNEVESISLFLNPAIGGVFEPGSVFKIITMAAALDKGLIDPNTTYEDKGFVEISGHIIKNATEKANGIQTMTQVLEKSLNSGAVFVQQKLGKDNFKDYVEKFGFGQKTGIDLSGEEKGNMIQLVAAFGAIANDGVLLRPYIVEKIIYKNGEEKIIQPQEVRRVISSDAASRLTAMMVSTVKNSFDKKAWVPGYSVAGKTGTAQIPDLEKGGYSDETIHTFGEFFPAYDPRFVLLIKVDKPKGIRFAADSITPLGRQITEYILSYYEIPPSQ
jgi:cell division protein FtsI/penicillin-binding protein 2